jgi:hypothetical protein
MAQAILLAAGQVGEEISMPFPFVCWGSRASGERLFLPILRDGLAAVGQQGHCFLEVHDDWFGRPGAGDSA